MLVCNTYVHTCATHAQSPGGCALGTCMPMQGAHPCAKEVCTHVQGTSGCHGVQGRAPTGAPLGTHAGRPMHHPTRSFSTSKGSASLIMATKEDNYSVFLLPKRRFHFSHAAPLTFPPFHPKTRVLHAHSGSRRVLQIPPSMVEPQH